MQQTDSASVLSAKERVAVCQPSWIACLEKHSCSPVLPAWWSHSEIASSQTCHSLFVNCNVQARKSLSFGDLRLGRKFIVNCQWMAAITTCLNWEVLVAKTLLDLSTSAHEVRHWGIAYLENTFCLFVCFQVKFDWIHANGNPQKH